MGDTTPAGSRCPRCSAAVRPGAPWCTQCYAPSGGTGAVAGAVAGTGATDRPAVLPGLRVAERPPAAAPLPAGSSTGAWPCSACAQSNDLSLTTCGQCGTPFLAAVREDRPTVVLPVVGDLLALSPARRVALAVCLVVVLVLVTALLALLLA